MLEGVAGVEALLLASAGLTRVFWIPCAVFLF